MAIAVTIVASGGVAVTDVGTLNALATPMTPVDSGGIAVTLVDSGGIPIVLVDEFGALAGGGGGAALPTFTARTFDGTSTGNLTLDRRIMLLLAGSPGATVSAWVRIDASGSGDRTVIAANIGNGTTSAGFGLGISSTGVIRAYTRSQSTDTFQSKTGATTVATGAWRHILATLNLAAGTIDVYLGGVLDTSGSNAATFGATTYTIVNNFTGTDRVGNHSSAPPVEPWKGQLRDVAIWPRVLSGAEITAQAAGTRPSEASGGEPAFYMPLTSEVDGDGSSAPAYALYSGYVGTPAAATVAAYTTDSPSGLGTITSYTPMRFCPTRVWRLKGSDASSVGSGSAIPTMAMRHAGIPAAQSTAGNRPTYQTTSGGLVRFASASNHFLVGQSLIDASRGFSCVVLANATNDGRIFSAGSSSTAGDNGAGNAVLFSPTLGLAVCGASGGAAFSSYADYTVGSSGLALFAGRYSGNEVANWLNGVKRNGTVSNGSELSDGSFRPSVQVTGITTNPLQIGRRAHSTTPTPFDGDIVDMILVEGALTDEEVRYLEGVMAWDNSQTALLPSDHPWKNAAPTYTSDITYPWGTGLVARTTAPQTRYLGSPSLVTNSSEMLALYDIFDTSEVSYGPRLAVTVDGKNWRPIYDFAASLFWSTIWKHTDNNLYILGLTRAWGDIVLRQSTDGGRTWGSVVTLSSSGGPLAAAGATTTAPNYHRAPIGPTYHDGKLFFACENQDPYTRGGGSDSGFKSFILYATASADLTNKANWTATAQLAIGAVGGLSANTGMIEGNVVVDDASQMWVAIRLNATGSQNVAAFIPITYSAGTPSYPAWNASYIKTMPGGHIKFQISKANGYLYSIVNDDDAGILNQRNRSSLIRMSSADLTTPAFASVSTIINDATIETNTGMNGSDSRAYHGFQYVAYEISGSTLKTLYRVGWSGADDYHDSNFIGYGTHTIP
jgi:hypothetical protein